MTQIVEYISRDSPDSAAKVAARIVNRVVMLEHAPEMGRRGKKPGTRELVITGLPYILIYTIAQDALKLIRIRHTSQNWPRAF